MISASWIKYTSRFICIAPITLAAACQASVNFDGLWKHQGYGDIYQLDDTESKIYQFNSEGCVLAETMTKTDMQTTYFPNATLSHDGMTLTSRQIARPFAQQFERLSALPTQCQPGQRLDANASPVEIYHFFWTTMHDYYAFFQERGIDWAQVYQQVAPDLSDDMSESELLNAITASLSGFSDDHVVLTYGDDEYAPAPPKGVLRVLKQGFLNQSEISDFDTYVADRLAQISLMQQQTMDAGSVRIINGSSADTLYGAERVVWGTFNQGKIGYLRPNMMLLDTGENPDDPDQWVSNMAQVIDQAMQDMRNTETMIIDMRFNGGGADGVSLALASRFNPVTQRVIGKFTRTIAGDGEIHWLDLPAPVNTPAYTRPVTILVSGTTVSAGEVFLMMMKALPQVTFMGETSSGALSDALVKTLPNGWQISLSNEVYIDTQYQSYEGIGIHPDIPTTALTLDDLSHHQDTALSQAIHQLSQ
ncbi:Peptidase family S41 [Vibrio ruber DSM 16370]|uniref:Peptidase family S41 n=1 Tax=Vibrio ruber (strain DSM 16370 / JCM 11486 / BCRC 17186 / CECT 7878 / LMG 23124 / VR1) TaxID=1123498 RepID=A0A1R4LTT6_VIBR1|nr:S41 family peptidase [Vibrio ruber]SJN59918.1 Peptidase family S41 [Vibrio ruber DSM 16370]